MKRLAELANHAEAAAERVRAERAERDAQMDRIEAALRDIHAPPTADADPAPEDAAAKLRTAAEAQLAG